MIKKIVVIGSITLSLFANELPNVLEAEKALKRISEETLNSVVKTPSITKDGITNETTNVGDFNVVGIVSVNETKYCYVLNEQNKIIKATIGMTIKGKKISDISDYGITVSDKSNTPIFYPVISNQVEESDITFINKEKSTNKNH